MTAERFEFLFEKFRIDDLTQTEWDELRHAIKEGNFDDRLKNEFFSILESKSTHPTWTPKLEEDIWQEILRRRPIENPLTRVEQENETEKSGVIIFRRRIVKYTAVAASLVLVFSVLWFFRSTNKELPKQVAAAIPIKPTDVAPGSNKAILVLANGSRIVLDSASNGLIANQSGAKILKFNGQLTVAPEKINSKEIDETQFAFNIISTPRGGQYQLVLPDGTKVWLNSASSLKFPTVFKGNERTVELTGEGYFEVAKNARMPFYVNVNQTRIAVLGTHFNIMAYDDEKIMNTTLLEGAVTVSNNGVEKKLVPGQQAILNTSTRQLSVGQADVAKAIAWKNGLFEFDNSDLSTIMRQLARWYDIEISYEAPLEKTSLGGSISRNLGLKEVLNMLEANGINHFKIDGKKVVVLP